MKGILLRATGSAASIASCLVLFGGVASAQSIDTTGPGSTNTIETSEKCSVTIHNDNNVTIVNNNPQSAESGDSSAESNTTVGSVTSGNASNNSSVNVGVTITNNTAGCVPAAPVTPVTPVTPTTPVTPEAQPSGGMGGGEVTTAAVTTVTPTAQVVVPSGGVGAGAGGPVALSSLIAVTILSGVWAVARLQSTRPSKIQA